MLAIVLILLVVVAGLSIVQLMRAVPLPTVASILPSASVVPGAPVSLPYPPNGEAEVDLPGVGVIGASGGSSPVQIASVAKIMTALLIVKDHPLSLGASGPTLTISQSDYQTYLQQSAAIDSVTSVLPGETLTEYQMLEGLLIPSADNYASVLATWDSGSESNFVSKMNQMANSLGLKSTHYTDPSGLDPKTVSNPRDQILLGEMLESNPVLAQIVAMPQVTLPVAGTVYNVNYDLGTSGIDGIKTGSTPAGGSLVFDAQGTVAGRTRSIVGAVLDQQSGQPLVTALSYGAKLAAVAPSVVKLSKIVSKGQQVAEIDTADGVKLPVFASKDIYALAWPGLSESISVTSTLRRLTSGAGTSVVRLVVKVGEQSFSEAGYISTPLKAPTLKWRLTRL